MEIQSKTQTWNSNFDNHPVDISVFVIKYTFEELLFRAANKTSHRQIKKMKSADFYRSQHSPIRTQMFWVDLSGIPNFVHTHFVRHTVGVTHFVKTGREDRGMKQEQNRWTPNEMGIWLNAETLINMSRKRLCNQAHPVTVKTMKMIKKCIAEVDPSLAKYMVRECVYRNGYCPEFKSCGFRNHEN